MLCQKKHLFCGILRRGRLLVLVLVYCCWFTTGFARAQERFIAKPARLVSSFPITVFTGGVILMKAQLQGFDDTLNFILDTGSGGISLDSGTCVRLRLVPQLSDRTILGIAGIRQCRFVYNQSLRLPGLTVDSLDFHVNDYDILTSVYGEKIDGIIGFSFFSRYIVGIDYDSLRVSVWSKGAFRYPRGGHLLHPIIANLPIIDAQMEDGGKSTARFYFDTGAGLCSLLSTDFAADSNLLDTRKKLYYTPAQGLGGKAIMQLTTLKEMRVGPYKFRKVPCYVFDDQYNVTSYPTLGGLVGNDILRRFNVFINYSQRCIYLVPNSHFRDVFDYSYTGLGIYWEDGSIRVGDVMKNSPAESAGLKEGDILLGVNNNLSNNIQTYKNILQSSGQKVRLIVRRGADLLELTIKVKSIR